MDEVNHDEECVIESVIKLAIRLFDRKEMMKIMTNISVHFKIDGVKDLVDTIKDKDDFSGML
jgi:hypothetical protein